VAVHFAVACGAMDWGLQVTVTDATTGVTGDGCGAEFRVTPEQPERKLASPAQRGRQACRVFDAK